MPLLCSRLIFSPDLSKLFSSLQIVMPNMLSTRKAEKIFNLVMASVLIFMMDMEAFRDVQMVGEPNGSV